MVPHNFIVEHITPNLLVRWILHHGFDLNSTDESGSTVLLMAVKNQRRDLVKFLIMNFADPSIGHKTVVSECPIHVAITLGRYDIVRMLFKTGLAMIKILIKQIESFPDLIYQTLKQGHHDIVRLIVRKGLDFNAHSQIGDRIMKVAISADDISVVKFLLEHNFDITCKNSRGQTCIFQAVKHKNLRCVKMFINHGVRINDFDNSGKSPMWYAILTHSEELVTTLITAGADIERVDIGNRYGSGAQMALKCGLFSIVDRFIMYSTDLNKHNFRSENILDVCLDCLRRKMFTETQALAMLDYFAFHGATVNEMKFAPHLPDNIYAYCRPKVLDKLISCGLKIKTQEELNNVNPPLQTAYLNGNLVLVSHLVRVHGVDVNIQDGGGNSVTVLALKLGDWPMLFELKSLKADFNQYNFGKIPILQHTVTDDIIKPEFKWVLDMSNFASIISVLEFVSSTSKDNHCFYIIKYITVEFSLTQNLSLCSIVSRVSQKCASMLLQCTNEFVLLKEIEFHGVALSSILKTCKQYRYFGIDSSVYHLVRTINLSHRFPIYWANIVCLTINSYIKNCYVKSVCQLLGQLFDIDAEDYWIVLQHVSSFLTQDDVRVLLLVCPQFNCQGRILNNE